MESPAYPFAASRRYEGLDSLRGFAAAIVVCFHCLMIYPAMSAHVYSHERLPGVAQWLDRSPLRLIWSGPQAVLLFFVLSGFVLSLPWLNGKRPGYVEFAIKRICRIYLPYLAAMALATVGCALLARGTIPAASDWINLWGWTRTPRPGSMISILLMLQNYTDVFIDNVAWTLVIEMRVSLIFPLLILPVARWGNAGAVALLAVCLIGAALVSGAHVSPDGLNATLSDPFSIFRWCIYFILGMALAVNRYRISAAMDRHPVVPTATLLVGIALLVTPMPVQTDRCTGLGATLILASALSHGWIKRALVHRVPLWLGKISYSLYLLHVPVLLTVYLLLRGFVGNAGTIVIAIPLALVVAWAFNRWIELPAGELGKNLAVRWRSFSPNRTA